MHILTRAEEEYLFKTLKANALKECDPIVKGTLSIRDTQELAVDHLCSVLFSPLV